MVLISVLVQDNRFITSSGREDPMVDRATGVGVVGPGLHTSHERECIEIPTFLIPSSQERMPPRHAAEFEAEVRAYSLADKVQPPRSLPRRLSKRRVPTVSR